MSVRSNGPYICRNKVDVLIQIAVSRQSDLEDRATSAYTQYNMVDPYTRFQNMIEDDQDIVDEVRSGHAGLRLQLV